MTGTVAVVTGAARGVGRGVALALAETGATVYVTDRESRDRRYSTLPGTVEDTAEQVDGLGGRGVPVVLDHAAPDAEDATAAFFTRVGEEHGGLDLLVANACNGNALPFRGGPFWTLPAENWPNMMEIGVRSHLQCAAHAAPWLIARRGLLVFTGFTTSPDGVVGDHLYYDLAISAIGRLAHSAGHDLAPHGVTALVVAPGFTRTEAITAVLGPEPPGSDPVERPGRAVCALLADPDVARHSGRTLTVDEAARLYRIDPEPVRPE